MLALLVASMAILSPYFFSVSNILNILLATAVIGVLAIGATFVICSAGLDLSLGSVVGFSGVVGALAVDSIGLPWPIAVPACVLAGMFCGLINGLLVTRAKIPAFIVTLGMLGLARGAALVLTNGKPVYGLPEGLLYLGQGRPFGVPMPVFIFVGVAFVAHYVLASTRFRPLHPGDWRQRGCCARHRHRCRRPPPEALHALRRPGGHRRPDLHGARQCR